MFAIIKDRGFQYRVAEGDVIAVNRLSADVGQRVEMAPVLAAGDETGVQIGTPNLAGVSVHAEVLRHADSRKVTVFKFKKRKNYRRKKGHRQPLTWLKIVAVERA